MIDIDALSDSFEEYGTRLGHYFNPKAALIDMDGVLYDSMPLHADAWKRMTAENGMDCDRDEFFLYEGMTGKATIQLLFRKYLNRQATDEECERLYAQKTKYFAAHNRKPLMPGADMMLRAFHAFNLKRVLVTGSGQSTLINSLSHDYPGVFNPSMMVTAADVKHGKPDPEPYLMGLKKAGCEPWEALVVENAPLGVESAHKAGCYTIAVATGPIPVEKLFDAGADLVFPSMKEFALSAPVFLKLALIQA